MHNITEPLLLGIRIWEVWINAYWYLVIFLHKMNSKHWTWSVWHSVNLSVPVPNLLKVIYEEKYCSLCSKFWRDKLRMSFIYSVHFTIYINLKFRNNLIIFSTKDIRTKHSYIFCYIKKWWKSTWICAD